MTRHRIEAGTGSTGSIFLACGHTIQIAFGWSGVVDNGQRIDEAYGLASQIRRSASSIPSNIAEGCGREGDPEFARFCIIARGSASELEYQLLLARDLKLIQPGDYEKLSEQTVEIKRMLTVLVQKLTADG